MWVCSVCNCTVCDVFESLLLVHSRSLWCSQFTQIHLPVHVYTQCLLQRSSLLLFVMQIIDNENQSLNGQVSLLEDQLKMASVASKRKLEDVQTKHTQLGDKLRALLELHRDIESHLST